MKKSLQLICFLLLFAVSTYAQDLTRGPYQQALTQTSVRVLWTTSTPTTGWIKVGTSPENLDQTFAESGAVANHDVLVTGLNPFQKYYYSIGYDGTTLTGGDANHFILTAKPAGDTTGFSAWVIGDFGKGNSNQTNVKTAFEAYNKTNPVDFGIMLGDNVYDDGTQDEYQKKVFEGVWGFDSLFKFIQFYSTPGNHDYNSINRFDDPKDHRGPYFDIFKAIEKGEAGGVPSNSKLYYSFDYGHVHFISLNSELFQWTGINNSPMEQWLKQDLQANKQPWTIVFFHQPPYSTGSHNSDDFWQIFMRNMRTRFTPIFEQYGVDVVFSGHSHAYERSYLIKGLTSNSGLYDPAKHLVQGGSGNPDEGTPYIKQMGGIGTLYNVVGNSGSNTSDDRLPARVHPIFYIRDGGSNVCGSLILEVRGSFLTGTYITAQGEIKDKYQIYKQLPTSTSVKENFASNIGLRAWPNPSAENLNLTFNAGANARGSLLVSDMSGRQLLQQTLLVQDSEMVMPVNGWAKLPAGTYVVTLEFNNQPASITVVKGR